MKIINVSIVIVLSLNIFGCATQIQCNSLSSCETLAKKRIKNNFEHQDAIKKTKLKITFNKSINIYNIVVLKTSGNKYHDSAAAKAIYLTGPFYELQNIYKFEESDFETLIIDL